jgi:hypothetical protein
MALLQSSNYLSPLIFLPSGLTSSFCLPVVRMPSSLVSLILMLLTSSCPDRQISSIIKAHSGVSNARCVKRRGEISSPPQPLKNISVTRSCVFAQLPFAQRYCSAQAIVKIFLNLIGKGQACLAPDVDRYTLNLNFLSQSRNQVFLRRVD